MNLDEALAAVLTEEPRPTDPRAFASEAGNCGRAVWYRAHGVPVTDPVALSTLVAFEVGKTLHAAVAKAYQKHYGGQCQVEVPWELDNLAGRADIVISTDDGTPWHVVEVKSISPFEVKYLKEPKREHLKQLALYARALRVSTGDVVYINKVPRSGESPFLVFANVLTAMSRWDADEEAGRLGKAATEEAIPARYNGDEVLDPRYDHNWQCRFCKWRLRCLSEAD